MTLLLDIAPYLPPASPEATGEEIFRRFEDEPDTLAICVVDGDGRPVGLVERNSFLVRMAARYGFALWGSRPIASIMKSDPLVADGDITVAEFCGRVLQERPSELLHGFIVTCGGRYAGVGTMLGLLQAAAALAARASEQAQEALAARARFLAVMSHEIRTPLNGVLAVAEIIRRRSRQPELEPLINTIVESGGVLGRLLNDALDLSRAEASGLELDERPLRLSALAEDVRNLWSPQAEIKGVRLDVTCDVPDEAWVLGDGVRLSQILNNLVSNALKFTVQGQVSVRLSATPEAGGVLRLRAAVADTGPGVPPERREAIFAPFQQTEEGIRRGGAGLGLAVCRQLAERMDGTIGVTENPGGGALFRFEAPLFAVPAPAQAEPAPPAAARAEAPVAHVLIADDNPTNLMVARNLCEIFGCTSETVADGAAAVEAAAKRPFDLILMDIQMPGMDGVKATQAIRALRGPAARVPIIALTANADPADAAFYRRSGMNGVVPKPVSPEQLLEAMNAVLAVDAPEEAAVGVA